MTRVKVPLLWSEIPDKLRMSVSDLMKCRGADKPEWLAKRCEHLRRAAAAEPGVCQVAVLFGNWERFMPCAMPPVEGTLCAIHGGRTKAEHDAIRAQVDTEKTALAAAEHALWKEQGLSLAKRIREVEIDRLHEEALR